MASDKFKKMVHYIVTACDPERLGATRLNKICWYADTICYRISGASITGEAYVKRKHGPVPKSILYALRELQTERKIEITEQILFGSRKMRIFKPVDGVEVPSFAKEEVEILDYVIDHICDEHSAASISELSHDAIWEAANDGEEIPMYATLVAEPAAWTKETSAWAFGVIKKVANARNAA
jgi:predicted small metal-binding protein